MQIVSTAEHATTCYIACYIGRLIIMRGFVILYAEYLLCELSAQFSDRVSYSS